MSPALLESPVAGAAALKSQSYEARDSLQQQLNQAFQQGQEFAKQQLEQEQADAKVKIAHEHAVAVTLSSEVEKAALRDRVEALHKREYRAPLRSMQCVTERQAVLDCYRSAAKKTAGDTFFQCEKVVGDLDKCATIVREATVVKIVAGPLPQ